MSTRLFLNNEFCNSFEQLKEYFSIELAPDSEIYADLLDYGCHGDIAEWLRERDEAGLASCVDAIDTSLSDSSFYGQLKAAITGEKVPGPDIDHLKPTFDKCFSFEDIKFDVMATEAKVRIFLKVLMCVNEEYELCVSSNWGMRAMMVNPNSYPEGKLASFEFTFNKCPGKDFGEITVKAGGMVLSQSVVYNSEFLVGDVRFKMIHVYGGTFMMGATHEQGHDAYMEEKPAHQVTLNSFSIGEIPVTQELWQAVMGSNPSSFIESKRPVDQISWNDCQGFIRKLNSMTGKNFRLPTEAEWEYAARGGSQSLGYRYAGSDNLNSVAWYDCNSDKVIHEVGQKLPNELGLYDMSGNVWEWCQDRYGCYTSSSHKNSTGPTSGTARVIRGGSKTTIAVGCRVSSRNFFRPSVKLEGLGLRLALTE